MEGLFRRSEGESKFRTFKQRKHMSDFSIIELL